ncbi:MAG: nitroreductase family protein, partial [Myxococcales bacterium]|nr:nitroreductase family protein [Myxococcales bacterium]
MPDAPPSSRGSDRLLSARLERSLFWRLKLRLQFTGWLQYLPPALVALLSLGLAALAHGLGFTWPFWPLLVIGSLVGAIDLFDVITVKLGLRPAESLPQPKGDLDAFDLMRARTSCRSFQARLLTDAHRAELLDVVARCTRPEALLGDRPIRLAYVQARLTVWPVVGAREFLVAIAPEPYDRRAIIDVGRSLQEVVLHATRMGLGTCWIGPGADPSSIAAHLGESFDPAKSHVVCVCAIGYASRFVPMLLRLMRRTQARRRPLASLFFADAGFEAPLDVQAAPYAAFGRCYEVCQWSPSSYNSQTTRAAVIGEAADRAPRVARVDFATATASRYYAPVALGIWLTNWQTGCTALGR